MKKSDRPYFTYPPNLNVLDLATLVSMYRNRGAPREAKTGQYFACAHSNKLIKKGKWWFGRYYSQSAWNKLLSDYSEGYPLTEVELNILGVTMASKDEPPGRSYVEKHSGAMDKLAFMIVNDLKEFGFLTIEERERLLITPRGKKALQGIAKRMYRKKFTPNMLHVNKDDIKQPTIERAPKKDTEQTQLF